MATFSVSGRCKARALAGVFAALLVWTTPGTADAPGNTWLDAAMATFTPTSPGDHLRIAVHELPTRFWQHANPDIAINILAAQLLNASNGWEVRRYAAIALGQVGKLGKAGRAVPILAQALDQTLRDWSIRKEAAHALGRIGMHNLESALPSLGQALTDGDDRVRQAARDALFELGTAKPARVTSFLVAVLADNDDMRAQSAAQILGQLGAVAAIAPLTDLLLRDDSQSDLNRRAAMRALGAMPRSSFARLRPTLTLIFENLSEPLALRQAALVALAQLGGPENNAVQAMVLGVLSDTTQPDALRETAAQTLATALTPQAEAALIKVLTTQTDVYLRVAAAQSLGAMGEAAIAAIPALVDAAQIDTDGRAVVVRLAALTALGQILSEPLEPAMQALLRAFVDPNRDIRQVAEKALVQIAEHAPALVFALLHEQLERPTSADHRNAAARTLRRMKIAVPKQIIVALASASGDRLGFDARLRSIDALGAIGAEFPDITVPALLDALDQPDPTLQHAAARAMARFGTATPPAASTGLSAKLTAQDTGFGMKQAAARALGRLESPSDGAVRALVAATKFAKAPDIRREAAMALGNFNGSARARAIPALLFVLGDFSAPWLVREAAGVSLDRLLHTNVPISTKTLLGILDQTHDRVEGRVRLRLWANFLAVTAPQHNLVALLGEPDDRFKRTLQPTQQSLNTQLEQLHREYGGLAAFPRLQREAGDAVIAILGHPNWRSGNQALLRQLKTSFDSADDTAVNSVLTREINRAFSVQLFNSGIWIIAVHGLFWGFLLLIYPFSRPIQKVFFWTPWVRTLGGLGYVNLLIVSVPGARRRIMAPFRAELLNDAALADFDPSHYFKGSRARIGTGASPQPLVDALPAITGQIVLEGESGLGKTMFLQFLLATSRRPVVFVPAAKCQGGVLAAVQSKHACFARDPRFLRQLVMAGALDVVVDGLNEVSALTHTRILAFAEDQFQGNLLLATQPMEWTPPTRARNCVLEPLSRDQIQAFLQMRGTNLPDDATVVGAAYDTACQNYVQKNLGSTDGEHGQAVMRALSNPMDLTTVADMIARAKDPNLLDLRQQQYQIMTEDFARRNAGRKFPLHAFSERSFALRLADQNQFDEDEFPNELKRMVQHRMFVPSASSTTVVYAFRHDKIMDFFLYHAFLNDPSRQAEFLQDARFRGVYLLLATLLPYDDAMALRETLIDRAAQTRDHSLSDEFIQVIRSRMLATVLFSDLVDSTVFQARIGDTAWRELMNQHDDICKEQVANRGGTLVKFTGDGILATFSAPTDAMECAQALRALLASLDLEVRFGMHTGEIERRGEDVSGLGVVIAARIMDLAEGGQVLTSDLTRQLMLGSVYDFEDRGIHVLKGVPGRWPVFVVKP
ncbi:MAG: HEAT repeat domain-containing protein [Sedimentitalea sp.]